MRWLAQERGRFILRVLYLEVNIMTGKTRSPFHDFGRAVQNDSTKHLHLWR